MTLAQRGFAIDELRLFSSPRSVGKMVEFDGGEHRVEGLHDGAFTGVDIALFSAGSATSKAWAPRAVESGAFVVDNSSAFRMQTGVPLVIPEINADQIGERAQIIANPNCTTILLLMALAPLERRYGVRRGVVATYQAASGAGRVAMQELEDQNRALLSGAPIAARVFPAPLAGNLIPHCDVFLEDGFTREEAKVLDESRKILQRDDLQLSVTAVRVPIPRAHSEAVHLELASPYELEEVRRLLTSSPGVRLLDRPANGGYPMPLLASHGDDVIVGRLRRDPAFEHGIAFFLSGDQLRKGAALNAVQIAELLGDRRA